MLLAATRMLTYMATLIELGRRGVLVRLTLKLDRYDFENREIWLTVNVRDWVQNELRALSAYRPEDIPPAHQVRAMLRDFVTGEEFDEGRMFRRMRPYERDVFELKTPDVRIFGWFYKPRVFIASHVCTMEKAHAAPGIHNYFRDETVKARNAIELDPPKCVYGAEASDVF